MTAGAAADRQDEVFPSSGARVVLGPWPGRSELGVKSGGEGDLLDTRNFKIRVLLPQQTAGTIHLCQVTAECQRAGREIGD